MADQALNHPLRASVVRIRHPDGGVVGLGLYVDDDLVVTCAHVVARALEVPEQLPDAPVAPPEQPVLLDFPMLSSGRVLTAAVEVWHPIGEEAEGDVAGLRLLTPTPVGAHPVRLGRAENAVGHPFLTYGFRPRDADGIGTWVSGEIRGVVRHRWLQLGPDERHDGLRIEEGFSGSPVWDRRTGQVVGLVRAVERRRGTWLAYALPGGAVFERWPRLVDRIRAVSPFRMFAPFEEADVALFHGREAEAQELAGRVSNSRLTVLTGGSGVGKSSLIRAGLLPRLRKADNVPVVFRPAARATPWRALAAALLPLGIPILPETGAADIAVQEERIAAQLEHAAPEDLVAALLQKVSRLCLLLVVDQLEELFHLPDEVVQQFGATLGRLARAQRPGGGPMVRLLLTVRIDAAHRVETLTGYEVGSLMKLKPPGPSALRQAIENPVRRSGFAHYEPGLVDEIVNDLHDKPYCLPVLQVLLSHLWERQTEHGLLSHEVYRGLRGGAGPIATHLDRVWDEDLSEDERTAGLGLLLHLVVPLEGGRHARRAAAVGELDPAQRRVADTLATTRMLTTGGGPGEAAMIELAHEALIEEWPRLREWVIDHDDLLRWRDALRRRMLLWDRSGQHRSALLGGPELKQGMDWLAGHPTSLSEVERSFIQTSVQARGRELVRTLLVTAVITFLVVGLGGMGGFWWLRDQAERQRDGIARSERIAGQIRELDNTRYQALIATGAFDAADTTAARSLLEKSYHDFQFVTRSFPPWRTTDYRDLTVLSADRRVQVTASYRTGLVHWLDLAAVADGRPPEPVELPVDRSPDEAPPSVAVTADGSTIATSVGDRITIWDRTTGRARTSYSVPTGRAWAIALDPTATVLSYIDETTVHWIDAQSGRQVNRPLKLPPRGVNDRMAPQLTTGRGAATTVVSYSGSTWLVGRADRSVRTLPDLDTTSRKEGGQVIQTTTRTTITGITTDSSQLVVCHSRQETIREAEDSDVAGGSGSEREDDGSMAPDAGPRAVQARFELWDLTSSAVRPLVDLPRRGCGSALLDPSGNVLALVEEPPLGQETLTGQYELSFWSVPQGAKLGRFRAPTDLLLDFVRHSDRWEVLLTDFDGRLDLLRIPPMGTLDFALTIAHLARYTPDGRTVVTQTSEGRLASWDGRTGHQLGEVQAPPPDTRLGSADERLMWIAPDGGHVITVADTGDRLDVWHLPDLSHGVTLRPPRRPVPQRPELGGPETPQADELAVGFVGGDEVVVYGDGTVTRWDRRTGQPRGRAWELGERNPVYARTVKIHPDGLLFTVDPNTSQVLRWDTETGAVTDAGIPDPGDPGLQVYYLMVAPDARRVALAYSEGPVILWDTEDRRQLARIDKDAASEPRYHLDDPFRLGIVGGGGLSWWRPEPANAFTRFWDRTPEPRLLPAAVHDLRPDGKELINGWPGVPLRRVSTDPNTWYRHLCRVLAEPSTAEVSWLDDRLPAERCSSE